MTSSTQPDDYAGPAHKVDRYLALAMRQLALDPAEEDFDVAEDALNDEMDRLWASMDPFQIVEVKHIVSSAVFRLAGKPEGAPDEAPNDDDSLDSAP